MLIKMTQKDFETTMQMIAAASSEGFVIGRSVRTRIFMNSVLYYVGNVLVGSCVKGEWFLIEEGK